METKFKVGDPVHCLIYGKGKIIDIKDKCKNSYPLEVEFESLECVETQGYTSDGRLFVEANITLSKTGWEVKEKEPVYKVGDTVKLVSERGIGWSIDGDMDYLLGKVVTLKSVGKGEPGTITFEGSSKWLLDTRDIECKVETVEDLQPNWEDLENSGLDTIFKCEPNKKVIKKIKKLLKKL